MRFSIDDMELGRVTPGNGGFWEYGGFNSNPNIENPWRFGSRMAPFDEKVRMEGFKPQCPKLTPRDNQ